MNKRTFATALADYVDFKIEVKQAGIKNRGLQNALNMIDVRYSRKQKLADTGALSEEAGKELGLRRKKDMAAAYADHVIVGWEGKYKGEDMPEYTRDNVISFLCDEKNDALFADVIFFSIEQANFEAEVQKEEEKNLSATSSGGSDTAET